MEEKILIQSKTMDGKKIFKTTAIIAAITSFITLVSCFSAAGSRYEQIKGYSWAKNLYSSKFHYMLRYDGNFAILAIALVVSCVGLVVWYISKNQLIVTDKRVSGKAAFGKRIDLPIDSVSAVATIKLIKGLSISTASGKVSFWAISNRDAIYKVISDLIIARQSNALVSNVVQKPVNSDYTEELLKIKELLDMGVISQEEFDAKKKQLLGL